MTRYLVLILVDMTTVIRDVILQNILLSKLPLHGLTSHIHSCSWWIPLNNLIKSALNNVDLEVSMLIVIILALKGWLLRCILCVNHSDRLSFSYAWQPRAMYKCHHRESCEGRPIWWHSSTKVDSEAEVYWTELHTMAFCLVWGYSVFGTIFCCRDATIPWCIHDWMATGEPHHRAPPSVVIQTPLCPLTPSSPSVWGIHQNNRVVLALHAVSFLHKP